jgi:hypothetical protein
MHLIQCFPTAHKDIPFRLIYANFQIAGFKEEELKKHMDVASYSYTKYGFDAGKSEEAWKCLSNIHVECWAINAMDANCKIGLVVDTLQTYL